MDLKFKLIIILFIISLLMIFFRVTRRMKNNGNGEWLYYFLRKFGFISIII